MKGESQPLGSRLSSLMWRAFARYGEFKYAHLLPVYRALGLARKSSGKPRRSLRFAQAVSDRLAGSETSGSEQANLSDVVEAAKTARGAVIFLPTVFGWETVNAQRAHHLAREFARQGYLSLFDCSGSFTDVNGFKRLSANLFLFRGEPAVLAAIPRPTLWCVSYNFDQIDHYPTAARTVYDWIDDLSVFPYDRDFLLTNHTRALNEASLVLTVARPLQDQAAAVRRDAIYLPNGVDYARFSEEVDPPVGDSAVAGLLADRRPTAGYYGALAEWFDYEMVDAAASQREDWNFLIIGPSLDSSAKQRSRSLRKRKNVYWIGSRDYQDLPAYLRLFDVALIPFLVNDITQATSPLKLYEYLAAGKAILSTPMPECERIPVVQVVRNAAELCARLDPARARGADPEFRAHCRGIAQGHSWTSLVQTVAGRFT